MTFINQRKTAPARMPLRLPLIAVVGFCAATSASASYYGPQSVDRMRVHQNHAMLRVSGSPPVVCTNYSDQFLIDTSVDYGKQVMAVVLAAQLSGRRIIVWYNDSTAPGTTEANGCTGSAMAKITGVQLAD